MRFSLTIVLIAFCASHLLAQNLIPNPSFEDTISKNFGLKFAEDWISPNQSSPDYYTVYHNLNRSDWGMPNNIAGYQYARSGIAYFGVKIYSLYSNNDSRRARDYIQVKLNQKLISDSIYCLRLYVSLGDSSIYASKGMLGMYLSATAINSNDVFYLPYTPQIIVSQDSFIAEKEEWLQFDYEYQASGGEEYLTIGNFNDSNIVDTLFVGGGDALFYVNTYYYIDDLYLGNCDSLPEDTAIGIAESKLENKIKVYPNPVNEKLIVQNKNNQKIQLQLFNLVGQSLEIKSLEQRGDLQLNLGHLPKGIYILQIIAGEERLSKKIIKR